MNKSEISKPKNYRLQILLTNNQLEHLKFLAESGGCNNLSEYSRKKLLNSDLGIHKKLNEILVAIKGGSQ